MITALNIIDEALDINEKEKEEWKVKNDLAADWCVDKIREVKAEYNRFEMVVKEKVYQLEMALNREKEKMEREVSFFEFKLQEYFESIEDKAKETKTQKSYKLPSGTLKLKKASTTFDYDKDRLLEYALEKKKDEFIKITKSFMWADFKKTLEIKDGVIVNKETNEKVEILGLEIGEKPEQFIVEV